MVDPTQSHLDKSTLKFLCSYGGKILPRYSDGKLRYISGHTRLLSLPRSTSFSAYMAKMEKLCDSHVTYFGFKLPSEDLDALVSITSDQDLDNLIEEYDRVSSSKISAFLSSSHTLSEASSSSSLSTSSTRSFCCPTVMAPRPVMVRRMLPAPGFKKSNGSLPYYRCPCARGNPGVVYLFPDGNHWH